MDRSSRILVSMAVLVSTCVVFVPGANAAPLPDLITSTTTNPPAFTKAGSSFKVTDTVKNIGKATAKASTTRYYLSKDKALNKGDIRFATVRKVLQIKRGKTSKGTKTVSVPSTAPAARYYLLACADNLKKVRESNEKNNCRASKTTTLLDKTPPGAPIFTGTTPPSPAVQTNPSIQGTAESASTVRLYTDGACTLPTGSPGAATNGVFSIPVTLAGDGLKEFWAKATDRSGNASPCSAGSQTYLLDTQPPAQPEIGSSTPSPNTQQDPQIVFDAPGLEEGAKFQCAVYDGGSPLSGFGFADCTSPHTFDLSGLGDVERTLTLRVRTVDGAGNPSVSDPAKDSREYVLDRLAQTPTITGRAPELQPGSPGLTNDEVLAWDISGIEPGAQSVACSLSGGSLVTPITGSCLSPGEFSVDLSGESDATDYSLSVTQTDALGNVSNEATYAFELDRQAPDAPTLTVSPANVTNVTSPSWTFTGETGATFECALYDGSPPGTPPLDPQRDFQPCPGTGRSYDLGSLSPGTYQFTFKVRQTDDAGNPGPAVEDGFTLDTDPPGPVTFVPEPPMVGTNATPEWSFTGEPSATFRCEFRRGAIVIVAPTPCDGSFTFDLSNAATYPDGAYTLFVTQRDEAGNLSPTTVSRVYTLDRSPPGAPDIVVRPNDPTKVTTPTWQLSGETGASYQCTLTGPGGTPVSGSCVGNSFSPSSPLVTQGTYTFSAFQTDTAGNQSATAETDEFVLDTIAPVRPTGLGVTPTSPAKSSTPTVSGSAEAGSSVQLYTNSTCTSQIGTTGTATAGTFSIQVTVGTNSNSTFYAIATDAAGNSSPCSTATVSYTADNTAPDAPVSLASNPVSPGADDTPVISGIVRIGGVTPEVNATVQLYAASCGTGVGNAGTSITDGSGNFSITVAPLAGVPENASQQFYARATDRAGNLGPCSAAFTYEHPMFEVETNNTFDAAQVRLVSESPTVVAGSLNVGDSADFWKIFVPEGSSVKLESFQLANGSTCPTADTQLTLYAEDGTSVLVTDEDDGLGACSLIDGTGDVPRDPAAGGLLSGGDGGTYYVKVSAPLPALALAVNYKVVLETDGSLLESESNNTFGTADGNITRDAVIKGDLSILDDDWFKLNFPATSVVRIESMLEDGTCPVGTDTVLNWLSGDATKARQDPPTIAVNGAGINNCAALTMIIPAGVSYIRINEQGRNAVVADYMIEVDVIGAGQLEVEGNDDSAQATTLSLDGGGAYVAGAFADGDQDWFSFTLAQPASVRLEAIEGGLDLNAGGTDPTCESGTIDTRVALFDETDLVDPVVQDTTDGRGDCALIDGTGGAAARDSGAGDLPAGTYYVRVTSHSTSLPQPDFDYRLVINAG